MIELRTLGVLDLRNETGDQLASVVAHGKRAALLVYLAAASPRGFHRRDTLIGLLWPELGQEHARASLRKAIHHLRRAIGDDVLVGRGDEELAVDAARLFCDAAAFDDAVHARDDERALALYAGPFLAGFFLTDAPEFENWIELERARRRDAAFGAAWRLAERHRAAGDTFAAAHWARRATTLVPDDEGAVRRLVALLADIGDRVGAVAAYEDFARRLRRDLDVDPSAETIAVIQEIRARPAPAPAYTPRVDPVSVSEPAPRVAEAAPSPPVPRVRPAIGARAIVVAAATIILAWLGARTLFNRPARGAANVVAVFPFAYRGNPDHTYLGEGMADLLGAALNGAGDIRTVDSRAVLAAVAPAGEARIDAGRGGPLAAGLHAGRFVLGDIVEANGRLRIDATLYDGGANNSGVATAHAEGAVDSVFSIVDALTASLIAGVNGDSPREMTRVAALTTSSLPALKSYLEGESAYRHGLFDKALDAFQRATAADSTFALAWYRLSLTAEWFSRGDLERTSAERAVQFMGRLSDHDRRMLRAFLAWRRGAAADAERLYQSVVGEFPDDIEAWAQLGEVWFHYGPLRGRSTTLARPAWAQVVKLEPEHVGAIYHLARIASLEGKHRELDSLVAIARRVTPESERVLELRALRAFELGDTVEQRAVLAALGDASDNTAIITVRSVLTYATQLAAARRLATTLVAPRRSPEVRALGSLILAHTALALGRRADAWSELAKVEPLAPALFQEYRAYMLLSPSMSPSADEVRAARAFVEQWNATAVPPVMATGLYLRAHDGIHALLRELLLGRMSARLEDDRAATQSASALDRVSGEHNDLGRSFAVDVRAEVAWRHGNVPATLAALDSASLETIYDFTNNSPFLSRAAARYLRAGALHASGKDSLAVSWYTSLGEVSPYELVYLGPSLDRRARILEALGQRDAALDAYRRLALLWQNADAELQPVVAHARDRIAVLSRR